LEIDLIEKLLAHADAHGTKLSWGSGATPGVGAWYSIENRPTVVWVLNTNSDSPTTRAYMVFYFGDFARWAGPARMEAAAARLEQIPALKHKLAEARSSGWKKYPNLSLSDVASDPASMQAVFDAISELID
jgi:hypothetical protein